MRSVTRTLVTVCGLMIVPAAAFAQATLAGTVKDPTGAVLPGVTIEASSPALIEKIRTALTDTTGQYRIESLQFLARFRRSADPSHNGFLLMTLQSVRNCQASRRNRRPSEMQRARLRVVRPR